MLPWAAVGEGAAGAAWPMPRAAGLGLFRLFPAPRMQSRTGTSTCAPATRMDLLIPARERRRISYFILQHAAVPPLCGQDECRPAAIARTTPHSSTCGLTEESLLCQSFRASIDCDESFIVSVKLCLFRADLFKESRPKNFHQKTGKKLIIITEEM